MNIRLFIIFLIILGIMMTLLSRVYFLSIKSNTYYEELSKNNYIKRINKIPIRGMIEDRNGEKLAINEMGFAILIKPHLSSYKKAEELEKIVDYIVKYFPEYDKEKLIKEYKREDSSYNHEFIKVIDYIPYNDFFSKYTIFSTKEDIKIESSTKRLYPKKELASHIIGYVGKATKLEVINNDLKFQYPRFFFYPFLGF